MNAKLKMNVKLTILSITAVLLLALASCNNPVNTSLAAASDEPAVETGVNTDSDTGLVAGLALDGVAILNNPDIFVSDGVEWVEGLSGNAMRGDADGDFLRIADESIPQLTVIGSVEVWVKPEGDTSYAGILHKGVNPEVAPGWYFVDESWTMLFHDNLKPYFFTVCVDADGTERTVGIKAVNEIELNKWSHLAATWIYDDVTGKTSIKLYVNGSEADATIEVDYSTVSSIPVGTGPVKETNGDLIIGSQLPEQYNASYGHFTFMGLIDEVSIYDVVRTAEEIQSDYQIFASVL